MQIRKCGLESNWQKFKNLFQSDSWLLLPIAKGFLANSSNAAALISGDSRNFVQGVSISLWKNFGSFRSISSVLGRFGKYRPKFKIWPAWSLCLKKKKNVLKTKANLHFVHRKTSKGKKKMKRKEMNKCNCTINYKFIWNINKIINYCCFINLFVFYKL